MCIISIHIKNLVHIIASGIEIIPLIPLLSPGIINFCGHSLNNGLRYAFEIIPDTCKDGGHEHAPLAEGNTDIHTSHYAAKC